MKKLYSVLFVLTKDKTHNITTYYVYANSEDEAKQEALKEIDPKELLDGFAIVQSFVQLFDWSVVPFNTSSKSVEFYDPDNKSDKVGLYINLKGDWPPDFIIKLDEFLETQSLVADVLKLMNKGDSNV